MSADTDRCHLCGEAIPAAEVERFDRLRAAGSNIRNECTRCFRRLTPPKKVLYWGEVVDEKQGGFLSRATARVFNKYLGLQPQMCVTQGIPRGLRQRLAKILASGTPGDPEYGHAACRICGAELGNKDLYGYGFQWPEKAEHYILVHDVWTADCDRVLAMAGVN